MTRIRVLIKISSDDAFELKAQALNNDPRLKAAGIAALKFVGDKNYIANGELSPELPPQAAIETPTADSNNGGELHVFVRIPNDDSYELKAQALNENSLLKEAGVSGLRFVGDKQYIADGEFTSTLPASPKPEIETPKPLPKDRLRVTIRLKSDEAYQLIADHYNKDSRLQEAGISTVKLVKTHSDVVAPVAIKKKPKSLGCLKWGIALGVIGALAVVGGVFVIPSLLPAPATAAPVAQQPAVVVAPPDTVTPYVPPPITSTSAPVVQDPPTPTDTPVPVAAQPDCSNDFSSDISNWSYFIVDGGPYSVTDKTFPNDYYGLDQDGYYLFDIHRGNTWVYSTCDLNEYSDVRIDVSVENQGGNDSATMLMCRYTPGVGWYEFDIFNNGTYDIMFTNPTGNFLTDYYTIYDGGSNFIKTGQATNEYTVICQGNTLSLYVNGNLVIEAKDDASTLSSGRIGIGEAWSDIAAKIRYDWVAVTPQ